MARCGEARLSFDAKRQAPRLALHLPATIASRSPLKPAVLRKGGQLKRQVADVAEAAHRDAARRPHHQIGDGAVEGGQAQPGLRKEHSHGGGSAGSRLRVYARRREKKTAAAQALELACEPSQGVHAHAAGRRAVATSGGSWSARSAK
eukprot:scaffold26724_cov120-Isochrysis_galbana.AAC.8